jgi:two-component system sensor histidine kinase KdpD
VLREREELERQTRAARELEAANRTRTALLAAVSHDLRTPLAGIRTAVETLRLGTDRVTDADRRLLIGAIEDSTARLTTIVADLLDMSRLQAGALELVAEPVSVSEVAVRALSGLAGADKVRFDDDLPEVIADPGLLERVLANLLGNAIRHGETVRLTAEPLGSRVRVRVIDDGPGVPDADRDRIFQPFQRLGDTGTSDGVGLGLAVARGLTEAQGGTLVATGTPGGGLTMVLDLPGGDT